MERIPKDLIVEKFALEMDYNNIIKHCLLSKKYNNLICNNRGFWEKVIKKYNLNDLYNFNIKQKSIQKLKRYYKIYSEPDIYNKQQLAIEYGFIDLYELLKEDIEIEALYG